MCLSSGKLKRFLSSVFVSWRVALGDVVNRQVDTLLQGYVCKQTIDIKGNRELSRSRQFIDFTNKSKSALDTFTFVREINELPLSHRTLLNTVIILFILIIVPVKYLNFTFYKESYEMPPRLLNITK